MSLFEKPPAELREHSPTPPVKRRRHPAPRQQTLALAPTAEAGAPPHPVGTTRRLWFCIYLPALPLEALQIEAEASAVFEEIKGIRRILLASERALAAGIRPGLSINAALALEQALYLEERNPERECRVVKTLAEWARQFTSFVCIEAPSLLLLEIAGSLRLFGGVKALRRRIVAGLDAQGFQAAVAIAPTPLAATWLARAGRKACLLDSRNLAAKLAPLPLSCLDWPDSLVASLRGMGIACIGDCLRLPRQGFARRFGAARLLQLDRALGRLPDPRMNYRAPERFSTEYELQEEQSDSALLLNICRELLLRLERFLLTRQVAVQHLLFSFFHLEGPATQVSLGCAQAGRSVQHWFDLLEIRFERLVLPAAVIAIRLRAGRSQGFSADSGALPLSGQAKRQESASMAELAERLSARIGAGAVHGVMTVAEHRPQHAWRRLALGGDAPHCANVPNEHVTRALGHAAPAWLDELQRNASLVLRRPLWMLQEPKRLGNAEDLPVCEGALTLLDGPERLETGWWDDDGIARDYFVARNPQGVHLWVFRNRREKDGGWYLHGIFG